MPIRCTDGYAGVFVRFVRNSAFFKWKMDSSGADEEAMCSLRSLNFPQADVPADARMALMGRTQKVNEREECWASSASSRCSASTSFKKRN